jgi:DNA mismatch repair protein MutS
MAILAQMGSFVPASEAVMPIFDAIFVRMGARDELEKGNYTCS